MFKLITTDGAARRGRFNTVHGDFETPAFMNVATAAAIKGGLSAEDLAGIGCQIMLCNTYHLHLRPGDEVVRGQGGLHGFTRWRGPILTDSGGFQVFSLAKLRRITEEGAEFASHIDGRRVFIGPEDSMRIQSNLGSTIAMAMDECIKIPAAYDYVKESSRRTARWLERCKAEMARRNAGRQAPNPRQLLFGINQGGCYDDLRVEHMKIIADMDLDGYGIGGLAVGETMEEMYRVISVTEEHMPKHKIRYLMGVGTPVNIIEAVARGIDLFDCVMPARNGRHGHLFTDEGIMNLNNVKYENDPAPPSSSCGCPVCAAGTSRAYLRHLFKAKETLALRFAVLHNLYFYNTLMTRIRQAIETGCFQDFRRECLGRLDRRI